MKYVFIFLCMIPTLFAHAQKAALNASPVYESPEKPAYFPYGNDSLSKFIAHSIHIGHVETGKDVTGKAYVVFIVEKDGRIGAAEILRTSGDKNFDAEAVRVAKSMPAWAPAKDKGEVVRSSTMLTFAFSLK